MSINIYRLLTWLCRILKRMRNRKKYQNSQLRASLKRPLEFLEQGRHYSQQRKPHERLQHWRNVRLSRGRFQRRQKGRHSSVAIVGRAETLGLSRHHVVKDSVSTFVAAFVTIDISCLVVLFPMRRAFVHPEISIVHAVTCYQVIPWKKYATWKPFWRKVCWKLKIHFETEFW